MTGPNDQPDRDHVLAAVARIAADGVPAVTVTDLGLLAQSLLSIAEIAMPDTYFADDSRCQLARTIQAAVLAAARESWFNDTCGDCVEGRCHWGGATSQHSIELAKADKDYEDPVFGRCGCSRHSNSVAARVCWRGNDTFDATALAWQRMKDTGEVNPTEDDLDVIWVAEPINEDPR